MRHATIAALLLLCLCLVAAPLLAEEPVSKEKAAAAEIAGLVAQLGAPDFMTRERASRRLLEIGEPARVALQETLAKSENMEARWRAEQLLKRLDREGERAVGRPGAAQPPTPESPESPAPPAPPRAAQPRDFRGLLEELLRPNGRRDPFAPDHVIEVPGLKLHVDAFGMLTTVELYVEGRPGFFMGQSLDDVLRMHPELKDVEGMADLIEKWNAFKQANPRLFPFEGVSPLGMAMRGSGSNLSIMQTPEGVKVTLREKDENGKLVERTYEGESLEAIRREHPEIAKKLKITVSFGPLVLPRNRRGLRLPVPPAPAGPPPVTVPEPPPAQASFGLGLDPVEPVLAIHLGLEAGQGVLVRNVDPGSLAQTTGVERHDVIVSIDDRPVTSMQQALDTLRRVGRDRTPVKLEVVRRGVRMTLPK